MESDVYVGREAFVELARQWVERVVAGRSETGLVREVESYIALAERMEHLPFTGALFGPFNQAAQRLAVCADRNAQAAGWATWDGERRLILSHHTPQGVWAVEFRLRKEGGVDVVRLTRPE